MKKIYSTVTLLALALALGGTAMAQGDGGCANCPKGMMPPSANDQFRKFQQETIDLRQEMMLRRFEVQRENLKGTPDAAKIAALGGEIKMIQAKIAEIRVQNGLPDRGKRDGECFSSTGGCNQPNGMGGCNGKPCGQSF